LIPVDPQLETARFQPLGLSSDLLVSISNFAFKCNLDRCREEERFFKQRVNELAVALTKDWDEKASYLERVYDQKFAMLRGGALHVESS
jgi:hypothetical protein